MGRCIKKGLPTIIRVWFWRRKAEDRKELRRRLKEAKVEKGCEGILFLLRDISSTPLKMSPTFWNKTFRRNFPQWTTTYKPGNYN